MRALLVQSYLGKGEPLVYPIGLASISASLTKHEIRAIDLNACNDPDDELKKAISVFSPDAVLVSLRNIDSTNKRQVVFYYSFFKETIRFIRQLSQAKIIVGGSGFSMYAREIMEDEPGIDIGVFLEGENTIVPVLDSIDAPERVKGVFYRKGGRVLFTGAQPQADLNRVRLPKRDAFELSTYKGVSDSIGIETKRGCALKCVYCIYGFLNGRAYRLRRPKTVVDDIESIVSMGAKEFTFVDSVFNIPTRHAEEIMREIVSRGIKVRWSAWFSEAGLKRDFVELAIKAGCRKVIFSPDGFSDETLKKLGKNITKHDIIQTFEFLKDMNGFELSYNFFKNPPGQSLGSFLGLAGFVIRAKLKMRERVHFEFNSLRIEPHTRLYDIAVSEGVVKKGDNLLYPRYYTNRKTAYIEKIFNALLMLRGK